MLPRIFVYGTLRPHQQRWPAIERYVARHEPATIEGFVLYDLPQGYPAIAPGHGEVAGALLHLHEEHAERAVAEADEIEGYVEDSPQSLYERVAVDVGDVQAYTYVFHPNRRAYLKSHGELVDGGDWLR
ncbi:MAG: gamma-glutamylcyclotransferase [Persicimonas sp.]